jgi:hypothetical protein
VAHDPGLRPDTISLPWDPALPVGDLVGGPADPFTGAPERSGVPAVIRSA